MACCGHRIELTAESLWGDVSARLRGALNDTTFRNWFSEVERSRLDDETSSSPSRTTSPASGSRATSAS